MNTFPPKTPNEIKTLTFKFANEINGANIVSSLVTCATYRGTDPSPASVLNGAAQNDSVNGQVTQSVTGGLADTDYLITVKITTATETIELAAVMQVLRAGEF